jgi:hypothetical protein
MKTLIQERTVVLSTNDNPDYLKYLRYCQIAWNRLGWKTLTFFHGDNPPGSTAWNEIVDVTNRQSTYRVETVVQCMRLFGGRYIQHGIIMTGDVDMIPMKNYWNPETNEITVYGHDLTGRTQYPICYIAMTAENWRLLIMEKSLDELLNKYANAKSSDFYKWWCVDQEIVTERLNGFGKKLKMIDRTLSHGLAHGRVDRHDWNGTISKAGEKIDAHMPRPFNEKAANDIINMMENYDGNTNG